MYVKYILFLYALLNNGCKTDFRAIPVYFDGSLGFYQVFNVGEMLLQRKSQWIR